MCILKNTQIYTIWKGSLSLLFSMVQHTGASARPHLWFIKPIIRRRRWGWRQLPGQPNGRKRIPSHGSQNKPELGCPQYSTSHHPLRLNGNSCSPKEAKQLRHSRAASLQHSTSSRRFYDYKTVVTWQYLKKITLHCKNVWVTQTVVTSSSDIETSVIRFTGLANVWHSV